ncbi:hypothetical protein MHU86_5400 [Fragilaria crotonensis]|nr:hypothetical protein MHU86_5400 [Fragilaria crotonensis]
MTVAEEIPHLFDCFLVKLDIVNCPMAEIPLADLFDLVTSSLLENYLDIIRGVVVEMLEDAMWIDESTREKMVDTGFALFEVRDGPGLIISLRAAALQRYVAQSIANRQMPISTLRIPIMVRFKMTAVEKITPRDAPVAVIDIVGDPPVPRSGPPSNVSEGELLDQVSELPISSPVPQVDSVAPVPSRSSRTGAENVAPSVQFASEDIATPRDEPRSVPGTGPANRGDNEPAINTGATFRGNPVDVELRTTGHGATGTSIRRDYASYSDYPDRERESSTQPRRGPLRYDEEAERYEAIDQERGRTPRRSPTKNHPYTDEVTFGAETFKDYMTQFQSTDVKFKDFRKITLPKFDSSKNDSFVHWYKLLVSTCLQYGVWCPPYESVEEDNIYGAWWKRLPQSVKDQEAFMAHLLYTVLIRPETFPPNSRELEAVEGSSANAGYNAIYNILRMHHPLLHSVLSMANSIPMHRRAESFSLYLRRLQEFFARERLATRTYTESEALDLAVRNLSAEWRSEFRRLVERDKRSGNGGRLPFKLALPQMATTFVEYASEIGRDPPGSSHSSASSRSASTTIMRRLETVVDDTDDPPFLPDDDVELIVRAIARNQESSEVCLGCQLPGHTLVDCNRFVDYIVAESLAQRNPTLRTQVANSHSHFRTRLNAASARSRTTSTAPSHGARVRSLQENTTESSSSTSSK